MVTPEIAATMDILQAVSLTVGILLGVGALLRVSYQGLVKLIERVQEAADEAVRQVKQNGHSSTRNTLKDDVSDLASGQRALEDKIDRVHDEHVASDLRWQEWRDEHLRWSHAQLHLLWSHLLDKELPQHAQIPPPPPPDEGTEG